jgi:hypothetical protein
LGEQQSGKQIDAARIILHDAAEVAPRQHRPRKRRRPEPEDPFKLLFQSVPELHRLQIRLADPQ